MYLGSQVHEDSVDSVFRSVLVIGQLLEIVL